MCPIQCGAVPPSGAPLTPDYPAFIPSTLIPVPEGWTCLVGALTPFESDQAACSFVRSLDNGSSVKVSERGVQADVGSQQLWCEPLLIGMAVKCDVVLLVPPTPAHPRAYLLSPPYDSAFFRINDHPHPRWDLAIHIEGRTFPAMCVYSAAEFHYNARKNFGSHNLLTKFPSGWPVT